MPEYAFDAMARLFIFRIDDGGDYHMVRQLETVEGALTAAIYEHAKNPRDEYRVVDPNIGILQVIDAVRDSS